MAVVHPPVEWAQRHKLVLLSIMVSDCENPEITVEKDQLTFKGTGGMDKKQYEITMKFFKTIDPEKSKYAVRPRCIEFALEKAEEGPYWDRLLEAKAKQHWLKVDFGKWKDEDDTDDEGQGGDLEEMMRNMGGLGGMGGMGGMPGMGGMGGMPGMGGMGGMPGMGGMDFGDMGMGQPDLGDLDGEDSDDGDLPGLE